MVRAAAMSLDPLVYSARRRAAASASHARAAANCQHIHIAIAFSLYRAKHTLAPYYQRLRALHCAQRYRCANTLCRGRFAVSLSALSPNAALAACAAHGGTRVDGSACSRWLTLCFCRALPRRALPALPIL